LSSARRHAAIDAVRPDQEQSRGAEFRRHHEVPRHARRISPCIAPIMIGYYDSDLRKIDGVWKLTRLDVKHSLPVFMG
jgi:hypothetical protein